MDGGGRILWIVLKWLIIAAILGGMLWRFLKRSEDDRLISKWIITAVLFPIAVMLMLSINPFLGVPLAACTAVLIGAMWAPNLGELFAKPFTSMYSGGDAQLEPQPLYSTAEARRKQGRYSQAIAEVQTQLAKFPNDFQGWLLLAQIQAEDKKDLAAAQLTICRLLNQHGHTPKNLAHALNRLADWQLKLGRDIEAARQSLETIIDKFPDSELALLASQRIAHLENPETLLKTSEPRRIPLPQSENGYVWDKSLDSGKAPMEDPSETAAKYVRHLDSHPLDYEAREKLAVIYAEHFERLDLAIDQFEQLISYPHQPVRQVVHWLNLLAGLYIKHAGDVNNARTCLERVISQYPKTAFAEQARQRMAFLNLEARSKKKSQVVKLGSYEQNIGLKTGWTT